MKKFLIFSIFTIILTYSGFSQFSISGEFRPRGEFRHGYKQLADDSLRKDPSAFVNQRSRINFNYKTDKYKVRLSLQDVRIWGDQILKEDVASTAVSAAWLSYKLCDSLWIKLGRQDLSFDDKLLLSSNDWNPNSQAHDALRLTYTGKFINADYASAYNQSDELTTGSNYSTTLVEKNYKMLNILWLSKKIKSVKLQLAGIADGYQKPGTKSTLYMRYTYGGGLDIPFSTFLFQGRGFLQSGKTNKGQDILSNFFYANLTDTIVKNFIATIGFANYSGNDAKDTANNKLNAFDPLYGSTHGVRGNMDYFTSPAKGTLGAGLQDIYLKTQYKCCKSSTIMLDFHAFMLQNNYLKNNEIVDKYLGAEIDLTYKYNVSKEATLELGYSYLMPTKSLEVFSGGDKNSLNHWAFIMFTLKPTFL
jgi:hypothetical protein